MTPILRAIDRAAYYIFFPLVKLIEWRDAHRYLGLQLYLLGYQPRRWESNKTRRRRLVSALDNRPFRGTKADYQRLAGSIVGVKPTRITVERVSPGCLRITVPRSTRAKTLHALGVELRSNSPAGVRVAVERSTRWLS